MTNNVAALVGTAGGVGTSRLTLECGATLARAGWTVACFDAAFATPGLDTYVDGPIDTDLPRLLTGTGQLQAALYEQDLSVPGQLTICPATSPFARTAEAMTARAAERFEEQLAAASLSHDAVLIDTPPIAGNQALAAVNAPARTAIVTTDATRGQDALARTQDVLADVGVTPNLVIANRATDGVEAADVEIPAVDLGPAREAPACVPPDTTFAPAVANAVEQLFEVSLDLEFSAGGRLGGVLGD